jgi:hypothetical protein
MTTICQNCKDAGCKVADLAQAYAQAWKGGSLDAFRAAGAALADAQSDCAHRAANRTNADTLARLDAIEARQDRVEAVLRAKGWM